jgi:hypothetical protein
MQAVSHRFVQLPARQPPARRRPRAAVATLLLALAGVFGPFDLIGTSNFVGPSRAMAKPPVAMDISLEKGAPLTASKEWYDVLIAAGVSNLRIHSGSDAEPLKVEEIGDKRSPAYEVHGLVKANNVLHVPGARFTLRDRAQIKQWIDKLGDGGVGAVAGQRSAFGLSPDQLREVNNDLKKPVGFSTLDMPLNDFIKRCGENRAFPLAVDRAAAGAVDSIKIGEQLEGLSTGTALAVAVRPAGLVLEPQRGARGVAYRVGKSTGGEFWPIGWKPEKRNVEILPKLFEMTDVEINDTLLPEALSAIGRLIEAPLLLDQNAMALHGIEPAKIKINLPAKKLSYSLILQKVLFQARLKSELRTDDAGKPFLWITTVKPAQ